MEFIIDVYKKLNVSDEEIIDLLTEVYVTAGFTSAETAQIIFDPIKVRDRGMLFASRETANNEFSGMVIVVPPESKAIVRAKKNECEIHLLGVKPKFRGHGLGRNLVAKSIEYAEQHKWSKIVLWTQKSMQEAQALYESFGFSQTDEMTKNGVDFLVYEKKYT